MAPVPAANELVQPRHSWVAKVTWTAYYTDWKRGRATRGAACTKTEAVVEVRFHPNKVMATIVRPDGSYFRKSAGGFEMVAPDGKAIPAPKWEGQVH